MFSKVVPTSPVDGWCRTECDPREIMKMNSSDEVHFFNDRNFLAKFTVLCMIWESDRRDGVSKAR